MGSPWDNNRWYYTTPENNPCIKDILIKNYKAHNQNVIAYFRHRTDDLLILNVAEKRTYKRPCDFLNKSSNDVDFPRENKTIK